MAYRYKDFLPLALIMSIIIIYTIIMMYYHSSWDIYYAMRQFEGAFFIIFGGFKLLNWSGFVKAYRLYDAVAKHSIGYAYLYPIIELSLGIAYLMSYHLMITNAITLFIMIIGTISVSHALIKQKKITCACLGAIFKIPMTTVTLAEDILMGLMAIVMLISLW